MEAWPYPVRHKIIFVKTISKSELFRKLPSVDEVLRAPDVFQLVTQDGAAAVTDAVRAVLSRMRQEITSGRLDSAGIELASFGILSAVERQLRQNLTYSLRPVINATGVILHTNLGRAPLTASAFEHMRNAAAGYSNLEFDLESGKRGKRDIHVDRLFRKLLNSAGAGESPATTQTTSTIVVNNNAAAVLLSLNTLAEGGEVIVSRGELVEIGGSFRIPDVMGKSNAILREVGTTNRTRVSDYANAITDKTRLILRVHRSNFEITGFTEQPALEELVELARERKIPLMEDLGSGALFDLSLAGIVNEPGVLDSLRAGVDVVSYSGDKLLGGPQAGILSGRDDLIAQMRKNSLFRAVRVDKLTYAALEATLLAYVKRDFDAVPALRMIRLRKEDVGQRAESMAEQLRACRFSTNVIDGESVIGGGAAPTAVLPTKLLAISAQTLTASELEARLRTSDPPVIVRVEDGQVLIDLRTVFNEQDEALLACLQKLSSN
jgi:L-seryl-tRNA(Ser) seleniumtransferase